MQRSRNSGSFLANPALISDSFVAADSISVSSFSAFDLFHTIRTRGIETYASRASRSTAFLIVSLSSSSRYASDPSSSNRSNISSKSGVRRANALPHWEYRLRRWSLNGALRRSSPSICFQASLSAPFHLCRKSVSTTLTGVRYSPGIVGLNSACSVLHLSARVRPSP